MGRPTMNRPHIQRPHWSYSQINQYRRCPLQYYFERVEKLPIPYTASGLAFGSAIHAALADLHRQLQAQSEPNRERLQQSFRQSWSEIDRQRPVQFKANESESDLWEKGVHLLDVYFHELQPLTILGVEQTLVVPLQNSHGDFLERPLVAVVDLLVREENTLIVDEFKTSSRKSSQMESDLALQATCYAWAVHERFRIIPSVRYTTLVKTQKPQIHRQITQREANDFGRLGDLVENVARAVDAQVFYPHENALNCATCPFRQPCREWTGTRHEEMTSETPLTEEIPC